MKDLQLYSWIKETDIPPDKSILLTGWARRMKESEVRSRCVLKDFVTTVRGDVFAPTPSPLSVRGLLLHVAWFNLRVETGDCVCAFMQADSSCEMFARPPKGQERDGWIWRLHGAMNGMRTASRDFTEFLAGVLTLSTRRRKTARTMPAPHVRGRRSNASLAKLCWRRRSRTSAVTCCLTSSPAGVEAMAHVTRQWRDDNANDNAKVLINHDEGNAHNEVDRHTFLVRMREVAPGLCKWLEFIYPTDVATHEFCRGRVIPSAAGSQQGCLLIGACHALVKRVVHESLGLVAPLGGFPATATSRRPSDHPGHCAHFCG